MRVPVAAAGLVLVMTCASGADDPVGKLGWMAGCWATSGGKLTVEEQWSKPSGGNMMGYSRTLRTDGSVGFLEFMRIDSKDGAVVYTPRIGTSQNPVAFRLVRSGNQEVAFENPAHDFPQRIIYRREGDKLAAAVEGLDKGKARREEFPYRRVSCD